MKGVVYQSGNNSWSVDNLDIQIMFSLKKKRNCQAQFLFLIINKYKE
jgi:hypothetical protein